MDRGVDPAFEKTSIRSRFPLQQRYADSGYSAGQLYRTGVFEPNRKRPASPWRFGRTMAHCIEGRGTEVRRSAKNAGHELRQSVNDHVGRFWHVVRIQSSAPGFSPGSQSQGSTRYNPSPIVLACFPKNRVRQPRASGDGQTSKRWRGHRGFWPKLEG